ncbi:MAG: alpha/beta hydrolase [Bacteroidetes bacterium]|jgi:pimeloyl-ACP methyl ester carboxylesterase|nr:alpha/beta hydrolase [Bacteroidota bacterium]
MQHLLLLHGALGSKDQFADLVSGLNKHFTVHTLNFSGHGGAPMPEKFSMEIFANDVLKYLDENKISKINIFGYSMGGYVALYLAKHSPEKIEKIFTLGTKFHWSPEIAAKETKMMDADKIAEKFPAFADTVSKRHAPVNWKIIMNKTAEMMRGLGNKNLLTLADYESIEHILQIGVGDKDTMVTLEETIEVYRKLKNASFIVLPNTQHPIEKIDINRLTFELMNFFKQ